MAALLAYLIRGLCAGTIGYMTANNARDGLTVALLLFVAFKATDLVHRIEKVEE